MLKKPARASALSLFFTVFAKGIGFLLLPVFTRTLPTEEYALYALFVGYEAIASALITLELCRGGLFRGLQKFDRDPFGFLASAFSVIFVLWMLSFGLFFAFSEEISAFCGLPVRCIVCLFLMVIADAATNLCCAKAHYDYKIGYPAAATLLSGIFSPLLALLLLFRTGLGGEARIVGATAASLLASIPAFFVIFRAAVKRGTPVLRDELRFLLGNGLPLLPHYLALMILSSGCPLLIGRFCSASDVGKFSVAFSCGMGLSLIGNSLLSSLSPWILRKIGQKKDSAVGEVLLRICDLYLPVLLLFTLAVPEIFGFLAGEEYRSALAAVYPVTLSLFPMFLGSGFLQATLYYERPVASCLPAITGAGALLGFSALLLPRLGYLAAAPLLLFCYTLYAVLAHAVLCRLSGEREIALFPILSRFALCGAFVLLSFAFREVLPARMLLAVGTLLWLFPKANRSLGMLREKPRLTSA